MTQPINYADLFHSNGSSDDSNESQDLNLPSDIAQVEIDRKFLTHIKNRFLSLNTQRIERAKAILSDRQQQFLQLLPLLFHVNHAMLPGYVSRQTPCGVHGFSPSKDLLRSAKILARSYTYQRDIGEKKSAISALFLMGSLGSIAQSDSSDLDVWVCHQSNLDTQGLQELNEKCQLLARWAADVVHIDAHFFLMDSEKFQQGQQLILTSEASGSAQHFLLLDEFYRTALWLAGKLPLWWFVPAEHEKNYQAYAQVLLKKRFLRGQDYLDFGGLPNIPLNEFIGAGIWQVYKGIEAPYKSVLKLLLLETYSQPDFSEPLSILFKRALYEKATDVNAEDLDNLDPYVLLYHRLEAYLRSRDQTARLDLVRRCFYFKADRKLSRSMRSGQKNWQLKLLHHLILSWGWKAADLHLLDNRPYWKAPHVLLERNLLANELLQGYRLLTDMAHLHPTDFHAAASQQSDALDAQIQTAPFKNTGEQLAISHQELLTLGRKLHAAFENKAGKIDAINPNISLDLAEPTLCFVETQDKSPLGESSSRIWQVFRGSQQDFQVRAQPTEPIKHARHFLELMLWCYLNGILQRITRFDVVSHDFFQNNNQRMQLWQMIQTWLPLPLAKPPHENFLQNASATRLLILCNLGVEPQAELHKKGLQMLSSQGDALGFSGFRDNLVMCLDVVQINSWGEIQCRHFGKDALANCLLFYLRLVASQKLRQFPQIKIGCFSIGQGAAIEQRLLELWRSVMTCFYSESGSRHARFVFEMANEILMLSMAQQQPILHRFKSYEKLLEKLQQPLRDHSPLVIDNYALRDKPLGLFLAPMRAEGFKIFYQVEQNRVKVSIADEKGALYSYESQWLSMTFLLRPLLRFISNIFERQVLEQDPQSIAHIDSESFGLELPTHHALKSVNCQCYELVGDLKNGTAHLEPRLLPQESQTTHYLSIKALVEVWEESEHCVRFYSEGKEFSQLLLGDAIYEKVAQFILSRRMVLNGVPTETDVYNAYITDLDLSQCREQLAPQTGLQLSHYLQIKFQLEEKLTAALRALVLRIK